MKFSEKLTKLRKDNNLSQEALAEKLNMSRQAISKWESGNSYPDMSTMINICKVLNCTLEDLLDDDAIGTNNFEKNNKMNINKWIKELLDFITKTYNMFWSMKLFEKIKCLVEVAVIILIIFLILLLIGTILRETVFQIFNILPYEIYYCLLNIFKTIYSVFAIILGFIITIHLFKIRYLDYYITVEDNDVKDKVIESDINKKEKKYIHEKKQEKIIIRDPKHTTYSFFSGLARIIMFLLKLFVILILIPAIIVFILLVVCGTVSLVWFKYGLIFVGVFIAVLGALSINYVCIELMYNFIFNREYNLKKIFIIFIIGLVIFGTGIGISITEFAKFDIVEDDFNIKSDNFTLAVEDNIVFSELSYSKIIIDNNQEDMIVSVKYNDGLEPVLRNYEENDYYVYFLTYEYDNFNIANYVLNDIKDKKIRSYDIGYFLIESITISQKNYDIIIKNNNDCYKYDE